MSVDVSSPTEPYISFLRTVPVFHSLDEEHLQRIADELEFRDFHRDDELVAKGDLIDELYILLQGEAAAFAIEPNVGFERELKRFYPGSYFGMSSILARDRAPSTIRAVCDSRAIVLSKATVDRLFHDSPAFAQDVCRSLAGYLSENIIRVPTVPFTRLDDYPGLQESAKLLPSRISRHTQSVVVEVDDTRAVVAMVNPNDPRSCNFIARVLDGYSVEFVAVSADDFDRHAPNLFPAIGVASETMFDELLFATAGNQRTPVREHDDDELARVLNHAIRSEVSDIHFEPTREGGRIRTRLDGKMMAFGDAISPHTMRHIISRLKVAASLDITNSRQPQDGRIQVVADGRTVDFRISAMPCDGGEKLVLRMNNAGTFDFFDGLFVSEAVADFATDIVSQPSGLVLVTGPTGSGKTATLYAALRKLYRENPSANIVTVEDPIEYSLDFATQSQVDDHNNLGFGRLLRSILRQDPNIILVGEIRDRESAAIAVEAATTGHLVLSSLHTHSALETITRMRNLDIPLYLLADALKGVISQKLLSRIHGPSSVAVPEDDDVLRKLRDRGLLDTNSSGKIKRGRETENGPAGGESGRVGMFEILSVSDELSELIETGASHNAIRQSMTDDTFFSFAKYGRLLLEGGHVSPEQVEKSLRHTPRFR